MGNPEKVDTRHEGQKNRLWVAETCPALPLDEAPVLSSAQSDFHNRLAKEVSEFVSHWMQRRFKLMLQEESGTSEMSETGEVGQTVMVAALVEMLLEAWWLNPDEDDAIMHWEKVLRGSELKDKASLKAFMALQPALTEAILWRKLLVTHSTPEELQSLFKELQKRGGERLPDTDLEVGVAADGQPMKSQKIRLLLHEFDLDGDGKLNFSEFVVLQEALLAQRASHEGLLRVIQGRADGHKCVDSNATVEAMLATNIDGLKQAVVRSQALTPLERRRADEDHFAHFLSAHPDEVTGKGTKWRRSLGHFLHDGRTEIAIGCLLALDAALVFAELLLLDLHLTTAATECDMEAHARRRLSQEGHESDWHQVEHALHLTSLSIICVFCLELLLQLIAFRAHFFVSLKAKSGKLKVRWSNIVDLVVIPLSLILELLLPTVGGFLIILRAWRLMRISHAVFVVQAKSEHSKIQTKLEQQRMELVAHTAAAAAKREAHMRVVLEMRKEQHELKKKECQALRTQLQQQQQALTGD
ncbi:unnamed protein product [Chrysoparadoxa australica]